jgi:hypothetical protein
VIRRLVAGACAALLTASIIAGSAAADDFSRSAGAGMSLFDTRHGDSFTIPRPPTGGGGGTPAFVASWNKQNGSTSSTTVAATVSPTVGYALIVSVGIAQNNVVVSLADSASETYTAVDNEGSATNCDAPNGYCWATFVLCHVSTAPTTITATVGTASAFSTILVDEYKNIATTSCLDQHAVHFQPNAVPTTANGITSGSQTTTSNGDLIYGSTVDVIGNGTINSGTGFTARQNIASAFMTEDEIQATAGSTAATFTASASSDAFITALLALKHS